MSDKPSVDPPYIRDLLESNDGGITFVLGGGYAVDWEDLAGSSNDWLDNDVDILNNSQAGENELISKQPLPSQACPCLFQTQLPS
jgi:hypothetical protein